MPAPRDRKHLFIRRPPSIDEYRPHPRKITVPVVPGPGNRQRHAMDLKAALEGAERESRESKSALDIAVHGAEPGLYIMFESPPDVELKLESLEHKGKGIELVAVQEIVSGPDEQRIQCATVFVPEGQLKHFAARFEEYASRRTAKGEPRHKDVIDRIAALRRATLRALWTDSLEEYPAVDETIWWEVWLRRHDGRELERLMEFTHLAGLDLGDYRLAFDDRLVVLVRGTARQLSTSLDVLNDVAEVRKAKESAAFFVDAPSHEQAAWTDELRRRTTLPQPEAPAVCVLDTGVNRSHPLIEGVLSSDDAMTVNPNWGANDDGGGRRNMGHGTEMAGLAAYGDLSNLLASQAPLHLRHRLESVKILPPIGTNPPELYGAITAQAVARPEVNKPNRLRTFSLAVTADDQRDRGQPTSWSAAIDALAAGRVFDPTTQGLVYLDQEEKNFRRLFVVSTGNVQPERIVAAHLDRSDLEPVHDPAQAWNALTVGAFTEKSVITDANWTSYTPLARPGDLSPWSTTSVLFEGSWPIKPDVVFEGGNVGHDGTSFDSGIPELCLLSTFYRPTERLFVLSWATSAATAQVARMGAIIQAEYPDMWPETLRSLIVHSAKWTRTMEAHLGDAEGRQARALLVRRYGFGVPRLDHALRSANDSLTLVAQARLRPFSDGKMGEMHLYDLPWPKQTLQQLGEFPVSLRVTLSYFVEPNPGRRGWRRRHRYASHGLRFEVKRPTESVPEFRKRLNQRALDEDEEKPRSSSVSTEWFLGEQTRNKGSIHSDIWVGTAADLAERGVIGIYPVSGWWKDQPKRDRSQLGARYALVVSIETDAEGVDIWTPVAQQIGVPLESVVVEI